MADTGPMILRAGRDAAKMTQQQLVDRMECISLDTLKRWEYGQSKPTPDDVDRIGEIVGDATLWHRWMLATEPSYRKRYIGVESLVLPVSVMRARQAAEDLLEMQRAVERDVIDGTLDDPQLRKLYVKGLQEIIATSTDALQKVGASDGD